MEVRAVKKHEFLQRQGDLANKFYFVKKGLLRSYFIDRCGKEYIFMFAPEGWVAVDGSPHVGTAQLFIDALEDSVVEIYKKVVVIDPVDDKEQPPVSIMSLVRRLQAMQERILMLMSSSAIERYDHFLKTYPGLSNRVSQKMIASYLGITPEALSKIKGKRLKSPI